jgi:signal transduction histidine kinase
MRAESLLSLVRIIFCLLIGARLLWVHLAEDIPNAEARIGVALVAVAIAVAISIWVLSRIRAGTARMGLLYTSVIVDTLGCSLAVGSNVIGPWPQYPGILMLPETAAAFMAMIVAAGFRVLPRLALLGAISNTVALAALAVADATLNAATVDYKADQISIYAVLVFGTAALAYSNARRTARLVVDAARDAHASMLAKSSLTTLLQGHHDAVGLLSAALFGVERLRNGADTDHAALDALRTDLNQLKNAVDEIRDRALSDVLTLDEVRPVSLQRELGYHTETFQRAVSSMHLSWSLPDADSSVKVAGGARALRRALLNLLVNAEQGDGTTGASSAKIEIRHDNDNVILRVDDDGPGVRKSGETSKARGTGLGLRFVRALAEASDGRFELTNTPRGAVACLTLRVATLDDRSPTTATTRA